MTKRDRNVVKKYESKVRELPADAMNEVAKLVDSATPARADEKEREHVER